VCIEACAIGGMVGGGKLYGMHGRRRGSTNVPCDALIPSRVRSATYGRGQN